MRIYFTLFRFSIVSLLTAVLDNAIFYFMLRFSVTLGLAQIAGRSAAMLFNYTASRKAVFLSHGNHRIIFPKYLSVVVGSGLVSYGLIRYLTSSLSFSIIPAKILVESILFVFNFAVLRDFVFTRHVENDGGNDLDANSSGKPTTIKGHKTVERRPALLATEPATQDGPV
jgi:putative flippase GtrA